MLRILKQRRGASSSSAYSFPRMAASASSLFFSHLPNDNFKPISLRDSKRKFQLPLRGLVCSASSDQDQKLAPISEKKSFAVATGEIFIGLASRLIKSRRNADGSGTVLMFRETEGSEVGSVVGEKDIVWEQRAEDVEAERRRKVVTNPGFSFSAAGLLFPYHLGVAKFLIEKGYIKVRIVSFFIPCIPICFPGNVSERSSISNCQLGKFFFASFWN